MTDNPNPRQEEVFAFGALQDQEPVTAAQSQWKEVWQQFRKHKGAVWGGGFLLFITLAVIFGPWIWSLDPQKLDIRSKDMRPIYVWLWDQDAKVSWGHPFGTDQLGRDILAQLLSGGRVSM